MEGRLLEETLRPSSVVDLAAPLAWPRPLLPYHTPFGPLLLAVADGASLHACARACVHAHTAPCPHRLTCIQEHASWTCMYKQPHTACLMHARAQAAHKHTGRCPCQCTHTDFRSCRCTHALAYTHRCINMWGLRCLFLLADLPCTIADTCRPYKVVGGVPEVVVGLSFRGTRPSGPDKGMWQWPGLWGEWGGGWGGVGWVLGVVEASSGKALR